MTTLSRAISGGDLLSVAHLPQAICPVCDVLFSARSIMAVYCSNNCKCRAAYYRRQGRAVPKTKQPRSLPIRPQVLQPQLMIPTTPRSTVSTDFEIEMEARCWQGTPIQRRQRDGWVNATAMCQAGGKRWNHYAANERTGEYICALQHAISGQSPCAAAVAGNPATLSPVIETRQGGNPSLQGTWIHPRLAVDLARWISPAFAVWMDAWFLEAIKQPVAHHQTPALAGRKPIQIRASSVAEANHTWFETIELIVNHYSYQGQFQWNRFWASKLRQQQLVEQLGYCILWEYVEG